jgi:hypothetical protein
MRTRQNAITADQIKDEVRKLNHIGRSEIHRSFDEEAAVNLILRVGAPGARPEQSISPVIKYRLLVGGVGIAYEGESESEATRQFGLFLVKSKTQRTGSTGKSVTLFKNYDILQHHSAYCE